MKTIIKLFLLITTLSIVGCGDSGSKKWRLDNPNLTEAEKTEFSKAIQRKTEIEQKNSWRILDGKEWTYLLTYFPELEDKCDELKAWNKFLPEYWATLISEDIRFVKTFEKKSLTGYGWFDGNDWNIILSKCPNLIKKADKAKVWDKYKGKDWLNNILSNNKILVERCDKYNGWDRLSIEEWIILTLKSDKHRDKLFQYVSSDKLTKENWIKLFSQSLEDDAGKLLSQAKFEAFLALGEKAAKSNKKDSYWKIQYEKQHAEITKVEKFNREFFTSLVAEAKKHNVIETFSNKELIDIMAGNLDYAEDFLPGINWNEFLSRYNNKFRGDFIMLLGKKPSLIKSLPPQFGSSLSEGEKIAIICENYEALKYFDNDILNEINYHTWKKMLSKDKRFIPLFIEKRPWESWDKYNAKELWAGISFIPELNEISTLALRSKEEWIDVVAKNPEKFDDFIKYYGIMLPQLIDGKMEYPYGKSTKKHLTSKDWKLIIMKNPTLSDTFDDKFKIWELVLRWEDKIELAKKYNNFEGKLKNSRNLKNLCESEWSNLLVHFPSMVKLYKKSKRSTKEWLECLMSDYKNEINDFVRFEVYKNLNSYQIAKIIKNYPDFLDIYCNDKEFIFYMCRNDAYKDFSIIGASLYFHIKNNSNVKAFALLAKLTDVILSGIKDKGTINTGLTGNALIDAKRINDEMEKHLARIIIDAFTFKGNKHVCLYYMARCYKEGYATEKNDSKSNSYYLILNKMSDEEHKLTTGEIHEEWETLYKKF